MRTITFIEFKKRYDVNFQAQKGDNSFVGAGGYGAVYKGHSHQMHFDVAIKRSNTDKGLLDEVDKASKVPTHKNIARYLDGFRVDAESGNFDVAILQYYKKGNLTQLIANETLTRKQLDDILIGILEGLQFLHEGFKDANGKHIRIIHRDLKPPNILIAEYNGVYTPLLTDFGISKLINEEDVLSTGKVENSSDAGTIVYKAPEQIQNKKVKNNLDLWAFGVMLFRILKGRLPFYTNDNPVSDSFKLEVMKQITSADLNEIFAQIADQPQKYQAVIKRCLVRNINERVQSAQELIEIICENAAEHYTHEHPLEKEQATDGITDIHENKKNDSQTNVNQQDKEQVSGLIVVEDMSGIDKKTEKIAKWMLLTLLGLFISFFSIRYVVVDKPLIATASETQNQIMPTTQNHAKTIAQADSLLIRGKGQLDSLDKYLAHKTLKKAVELNPALKPQVYKLFTKKINEVKHIPEVAIKYKALAQDFK
jgi:serine/threonine protein kinase